MNIWRTENITLIETQELDKLRELNAELLAELKFTLHLSEKESLDYFDDDRVRKVIAKAEKLSHR